MEIIERMLFPATVYSSIHIVPSFGFSVLFLQMKTNFGAFWLLVQWSVAETHVFPLWSSGTAFSPVAVLQSIIN